MNDLVKRDIAKRAPPPVPATPAAPVVAAPPPPYTPPVRSSSGTPTPSVFKGAGGGGIARPAYGLREQYEAQQAARARSLEEERKAAVQAERRRLLEAQQQRVAEQRAAQVRYLRGVSRTEDRCPLLAPVSALVAQDTDPPPPGYPPPLPALGTP